jgi:hypothetical protein
MPLSSLPEVLSPDITSQSYGRNRPGSRVVFFVEWALLFAALLYCGGRVLPRAWQHLNTDFPNYYVTARLLREGYSTSRVYEWIWFQRQKDHMGISRSDQPVVGFVPHTPFSALLMWPLTYWPPLTAKRIWIVFNFLLLGAVAALLRSLTHLPWRRLALLLALSYPLLRNFEYGQYYIVLLFLITAALLLYLSDKRFAAGALLGMACGLKIFPGFFVLYFARKRDHNAILGLVAGALTTVIASVWAFGLALHWTYLTQVLPWALRGDAMDPYSLGLPSLSSLLHRLLLFEPEWNPHPLVYSPLAFAILLPLLQLLVLAPAIYLAIPKNRNSRQVQLEWSAFLVGLLAISTLPASYHFTLLILPAAVLASLFLQEKAYKWFTPLALLYLAIGFPAWPQTVRDGWWTLLGVPRLYCLLLLCVLCYATLRRQTHADGGHRTDRRLWAAALVVALVVQVASTLYYQRAIHEDEHSRLTTSPDILLATEPVVRGDDVSFIAMRSDGYSVGLTGTSDFRTGASGADELSQAASRDALWVEEVGKTSVIVKQTVHQQVRAVEINDAEFPVLSPVANRLAYLRSSKGRAAIWLRTLIDPASPDIQMTPAQFDVEEMTFLPDGSLIFAAAKGGYGSALYMAQAPNEIEDLHVTDARYPAASPNGHWLAYSRLNRGVWQLWLKDLRTGTERPITNASCNNISPSWSRDSTIVFYASDCGRALWFTALHKLQIVP